MKTGHDADALGYLHLSHGHSFTRPIIASGKPQTVTLTGCPALLWIEQVPIDTHAKPVETRKAAGLKGLDVARLGTIRTDTGLIVRADR